MTFEQSTIKVENERDFSQLKSMLDRAFGPDRVVKYLKKLDSRGVRIRDWDAVLASNAIEVVADAQNGTATALHAMLTVSDRAQIREFYLSKIEDVDPALRARFSKLYQYY